MDIIDKIRKAKSLDELDHIAVHYFSAIEDGDLTFDEGVHDAFQRRESELTHMGSVATEAMDLVRNHMDKPEEHENNLVPFDLTRRKVVPPEDNYKLKKAEPSAVKCGCPIKYGVPCIHKTHFEGIVPQDYEECETCGCDHKYDPRLAKEVHSKLGETI